MAALDGLPDPAAPEAVELMIVLAFDGLFRADFDAMRDAAARALAAARPLGDRPLTATAAVGAHARLRLGRRRSRRPRPPARRPWPWSTPCPTTSSPAASTPPAYLAAAELYLDRYEEDDRACRASPWRSARATGQQFPTLVPTLASAYFMRGRLADAIEVIEGGVESARLASNVQDLVWRLHIRSSAALAAGDLDTSLPTAEEAMELTRELDEKNFLSAYPGLGLAAALLPSGDPARAVEVLVGSAAAGSCR